VSGLALPGAVIATLCVMRTLAAVLFTWGLRARAAGIVAAGCGYLVLAQDRFAFINSLHVLYLATFVVALTVATGSPALVTHARTKSLVASSVRLVSLVLASIYFWAGVAKVQWDWLSGHALEAHAQAGAFAGPLGAWVERAWCRGVASWTIPGLELTIAALLLADRRRAAIVLALGFHAVVELTVLPDLLGFQMAVLLLAIWPQSTGRNAARCHGSSMPHVGAPPT
jgi:hypothetical protein